MLKAHHKLILDKWPKLNMTATVKMHGLNPTLVNFFWDTLPFRSLQTHALVSGNHLYHRVLPEALIYSNPQYNVPGRADEPNGTVFLSKLQHLAIKYDPVTESHPAARCANIIPEDLEKLRWVGHELRRCQYETKQPIEVVLWDTSMLEPDPKTLSLRLQRTDVTRGVKALVEEVHKEVIYWLF
ncbi:hypothetical protein ETB97_008165 [Aspergillus alliaceus]|uniref:Uncharacterized protein n=1 Tax=Petromyces alliaceus TaxID=209559 RepID=A0A8H5ZTB4_PETAA|nr:hypothetical protein ETB97_008165 [Aspergillus burnettii]